MDQLGIENCTQLVKNPLIIQGIMQQTPGAMEHVEWFGALVNEISGYLDDMATDGDIPEGGGPDTYSLDAISEGGEID